MTTEFKSFTNDDWHGYAGAEGDPLIARPDITAWKGSDVVSVEIIVDVSGASLFMTTSEYETNSYFMAASVQGRDVPSQAAMDSGTKALVAAEQCKNHLELAGVLSLAGWEFIPC